MPDMLLLISSITWAALAVGFLTAAGRVYGHREQLPLPESDVNVPRLSIVIPARDEAANIGECLQSITQLEYPEGDLQVIVVDDHSTDATASIVREYAEHDPRIELLSAPSLAEGWIGKSHACWHGVNEASGDWLLFIDADTFLKPAAVRSAVAYALDRGFDFLSVSPFQRIVSFGERIALPGIFLRFAAAIDFRRVNDPNDPVAVANGQFLLFSRDAYDRIGGHEAIRSEVSDDLAFARAAKREGISARTVFGEAHMETRMYRSLTGIWHGFTKNALEIQHARSSLGVFGAVGMSFGLAAGGLLPLIVIFGGGAAESISWMVSASLSIVTAATLTLFFALSLRALRVPLIYLVALPFGLAMHGAITLNAFLTRSTGSRTWKGRRY